MTFDLPTLLFANSFVTAMAGAILVVVYLQMRDAPGVLFWGLGNLLAAIAAGVYAIEAGLPGIGFRTLVAICVMGGGGFYWSAARASRHARPDVPGMLLGPVLWLAALAIPEYRASPPLQMAAATGMGAIYSALAALEIWRGRAEKLKARWPLFGILAIDFVVNIVGSGEALLDELTPLTLPPLDRWFGLVYFDTFLLTVGGAIFTVLLARERAELVQRTAARLDVLTGVANRRAFMDHAETALAECLRRDAPLSLIFFDLDHFKAINDLHGHATGDRVIQAFARTAKRILRSEDTIGRIGGEEFAVVLPDIGPGTAFVIADRIRIAFAEDCRDVAGRTVNATVSGGIATAGPSATLDSIIQAGDEALYRAKSLGRNRVERAAGGRFSKPASVIRLA